MSTQTTSSSSSYYLIKYHGKGCKNEETITSNVVPTMIRSELKIDRARSFLAFRPKYGISIAIPKSGNFRIKASASPNNPPSSWQKWLLGLLLTVILPAVGQDRPSHRDGGACDGGGEEVLRRRKDRGGGGGEAPRRFPDQGSARIARRSS
ncbi:UNVERIFIED_CONTAM: hypothetical protein Sangu_1182200 [Sesamum angustifolium]|uniref:Uncharacterized protein n=1 Tax=Sesamum angustifolium TaxID=2727405 RepID=A0AAW2NI89_9LAMI